MDVRLVASSETAPVVLKCLRCYGRIAEPRMAFDVWWFSQLNVAPCGRESIVITVPGDLRKLRRRRWLGIHGSRMRTSSQGEGQQQRRHGKPFLHTLSSSH
jgi:hypothetical protein